MLETQTLARSRALPLKPDPVTLAGRFVRLEPLVVERDAEALFRVSNGAPIVLGDRVYPAYDADLLVWRYMSSGPFANVDEFRAYLQARIDTPDALCLCVCDTESSHPIGLTTYMSNIPAFLRIELGNIWYSPIAQRTPANQEATYLMLCHAFELGYRRVEWKCDANNERSRRAALRMGFQFEGIQEQHMIVKRCNRDTAWFRILDVDWPAVRQRLQTMLYGNC